MNYESRINNSGSAQLLGFCFACYHACSGSCSGTCKGGCSAKCGNQCSGSCGNNCTDQGYYNAES